MNKKEIEIPEGYEIDQVTFKKIEKKLPKTWEELGSVKGWYIDISSEIEFHDTETVIDKDYRNIFPTKELAEASLALAQLLQLRDVYNDGWVADWNDLNNKYCLQIIRNKIVTCEWTITQRVINFKTAELRDEFFENFKDLLTIAKPLL